MNTASKNLKLAQNFKTSFVVTKNINIAAAFRGMHASPAKHSSGKCDRKV